MAIIFISVTHQQIKSYNIKVNWLWNCLAGEHAGLNHLPIAIHLPVIGAINIFTQRIELSFTNVISRTTTIPNELGLIPTLSQEFVWNLIIHTSTPHFFLSIISILLDLFTLICITVFIPFFIWRFYLDLWNMIANFSEVLKTIRFLICIVIKYELPFFIMEYEYVTRKSLSLC